MKRPWFHSVLFALLALGMPVLAQARAKTDPRWVRDPKLQVRIDKAVEKGIAHLRSQQVSDGRWTYANQPLGRPRGGELKRKPTPSLDGRRASVAKPPTQERDAGLTALALYALSVAGAPPEDKSIQAGLRWIADHPTAYDKGSGVGTYSISLLILALTRIDPVEHGSWIRLLADRLARAQSSQGMWSYRLRAPRPKSFPRYAGTAVHAGDNSNTQFAVLALWAAHSLAGYRPPDGVWQRVAKHFKLSQQRDGSWAYRARVKKPGRRVNSPGLRAMSLPRSASMTAAGLVSYVYASAAVNPKEAMLQRVRASPIATRGVSAFRHQLNQRIDWRNLYLVYSIERVGTVLAVRDHTWYEKGAAQLCGLQHEGGSWKDATGHGDSRAVYATSLALLFLTRATLPPQRGLVAAPPRLDVMTASERTPLLQTAKSNRRAFEIYMSLPAATRRGTAGALGSRGKAFVDMLSLAILQEQRAAARAAAHELLEELLGKRFLYDAAASKKDRDIMARQILGTWKRMRANAVWDVRSRHYVSR